MSFLNFFKKQNRREHQPVPPETGRDGFQQPDQSPDATGPNKAPGPPIVPLPEKAGESAVHQTDGPVAESGPPAETAAPSPGVTPPGCPTPAPKPLVKKVYFLGGSHEKLNQRLKDELKMLGFSWIDLSSTYMEKALDEVMKNNLDVFFCVATLSGDEFVYDKNSKPSQARICSKQDVVFKLGYMIGHYGKSNCFVLYKEQKSFTLPTSLIHGIFTVLDDDVRWKDMLKSRLIGSGYSISC
ncbi:MAG: TIR domain-containing protein [Candidatus Omnitrophota bacterium]|jgi:hypothetical protein